MAKMERHGVSPDTKDARAAGPAMAMDIGATPGATSAVPAPANGVDRDGRPYCGKHNCVMIAQSGQGGVTYYRCRVPGCEEREKRLRGQVPREPLWCGQRSCRDKPPALEVVPERSNFSALVMCCPRCGFETIAPRPGFELAATPIPPAEDFSTR